MAIVLLGDAVSWDHSEGYVLIIDHCVIMCHIDHTVFGKIKFYKLGTARS